MDNLFEKRSLLRLLFSIIVVLGIMLNACSGEAKSLKKGEVYRSLDGAVIEVISDSELDISGVLGTRVAKYGFKDDKLRVVIGDKVIYFEITKEGLKQGNTVYYTKAGLVKKRAELVALEEKRKKEEMRKAELALEEKRKAEEKRKVEAETIKNRFISSDLIILDKETKLMWTREASIKGGRVSWNNAFEFVKQLNEKKYAGYGDWRLPTKEEIETIFNFARSQKYHNDEEVFSMVGFVGATSSTFWSSTTDADNSSEAWHAGYNIAGYTIKPYGKYYVTNVWPVRGGQ